MKRNVVLVGATLGILCLLLCGCVSDKTYKGLLDEKEALVLDKDKLSAQNDELNGKIAGLVKERDGLVAQVATLNAHLKEAQEKGTAAEANIASLQAEVLKKEDQIKALNAEIGKLNKQIEELKAAPAPAPAPGVTTPPAGPGV
jgi:chromosome segregation ATPase